MSIEQKLADLGIALPDAPAPAANYVPFVKLGDTLYVSGQISSDADGLIRGKLGAGDFQPWSVWRCIGDQCAPGLRSLIPGALLTERDGEIEPRLGITRPLSQRLLEHRARLFGDDTGCGGGHGFGERGLQVDIVGFEARSVAPGGDRVLHAAEAHVDGRDDAPAACIVGIAG